MTDQENEHPFNQLTPGFLLDAVESIDLVCDGRLLVLNSYENRVYQVGIEGELPMIAKFYRPDRWTDEQILEEHQFCFELADHELPVVAPARIGDAAESLFHYRDFRFSLYPRQGGHAPELDNADNLFTLGRMLGRIHRVGAASAFNHRPRLTIEDFGHQSVAFVSEHFIPADLRLPYETLAEDVLAGVKACFAAAGDVSWIRTHGDCHIGNLLWRDDAPHFVDFDDARTAPAIQDLWLLLSGEYTNRTQQLSEIIAGYEEFHDFDARELHLVEALRALRILHHSAWLAKRWSDPAFPRAFTWFNTPRYWSEHILELREQLAALQEPPLQLL